MREHAGSSFVLSLLIVSGFAILLFPDEKGLKTAAAARPRPTGTAAEATPAAPPPSPHAPRPSLTRSLPKPPETHPTVARATAPDAAVPSVPPRTVVATEPAPPRATFTAAARPIASVLDDDAPRLEPIELAEAPEPAVPPIRRRVGGSWQPGPAQRGR